MDKLPVELVRLLIETQLSSNQPLLYQLCLVNRVSYAISLPLLWRKPLLRNRSSLNTFLGICNQPPDLWLIITQIDIKTSSSVPKYGEWIEEWTIEDPQVRQSFTDYDASTLLRSIGPRLRRLNLAGSTELSLAQLNNMNERWQPAYYSSPVTCPLPNLEALSLEECCRLDANALCNLLQYCPNLHTLNLSRAFSIDDQTLATIGSFCPNLTALNVNFCFSITDRGLVGFMRAASRDFNQELPLKQLSLANCHLVSTEGVMRSADTCPQLQYLRLTACKALDGQAFIYLLDRCKQLRYLFLTSCNQMVSDETLRDASERLNGQQLSLRYMDVSFCTEIQDLSLLQRFIGEHCPQLTSLDQQIRQLSKPSPPDMSKEYEKWYCHIKGRPNIERFIDLNRMAGI